MLRNTLGMSNRMKTPDRDLLEDVVLPGYVERHRPQTVLFVGCEWFTRHYEKLFSDSEYWTVDPDPWKRRFGSRRHVVAALEDLDRHFAAGHFDLIVCNGVYGWGLNDQDACERAFQHCYTRLRDGGHFMLGWNDVPEHRPVPLDTVQSLARFTPERHESLGAWQYVADPQTRHIFNFYVKAVGSDAQDVRCVQRTPGTSPKEGRDDEH